MASPNIFSAQSGNWSDPQTWSGGVVPGDGDRVGIRSTHTVIYDADNPNDIIDGIGILGQLRFRTDANTHLRVNTIYVYLGNNGHMGVLEIGTAQTPVEDSKYAKISFPDGSIDTALDPQQFSHGIVVAGGKIVTHGSVKTPFVRLAAEAKANDTALALASAPTGWRPGDLLFLPDSRHLGMSELGSSFSPRWEYPTVSSVNDKTVNLNAPLAFLHPGWRDKDGNLDTNYLPHAVNLTRNIKIYSENPDGFRAHTIFTGHHAYVDVRYTEFNSLGRTTHSPLDSTKFDSNGNVTHIGTNQIGRYAVHIHHVMGPMMGGVDDGKYQLKFVGNVVTDTSLDHNDRWAVSIHSSNYGLYQGNIAHHYSSWGIGQEHGDEWGNEIDGNFSCRINSPNGGVARIDQGSERGVHGRDYYLASPATIFTNNVSCNSGVFSKNAAEYGYSVSFFHHANSSVQRYWQIATTPGSHATTKVDIGGEPFWKFENHECYGQPRGMEMWRLGGFDNNPYGTKRSHINGLKMWHVWYTGFFWYPSSTVTVTLTGRGQWDRVSESLPLLFTAGDYMAKDLILSKCDAQGYGLGIEFTSIAYNGDGNVQRLEDSYFCTLGYAASCGQIYSSGGSSDWLTKRAVEIHNTQFDPFPGKPLKAINCHIAGGASSIINWVVDNTCKVYGYQKNESDNFQIYWDQQAADYITPQTKVHPGNPNWNIWTGATKANQTNEVNWAEEGKSVCGSVRPTTGMTTRVGIPHQVKELD